ncbi:MAG TPA: alpha/beta fold hydrolase [Solimonas sp.]|nr:alpha/beta fold hydrolase [Solimonas sp.]
MSPPVRERFAAALIAGLLAACGAATSPADAPLICGTTGPALHVDPSAVEAAIGYPARSGSEHDPVLLLHGTGSTSFESWAATYVPALGAAGYEVYTLNLPGKAYADIQQSTEYLVYAVRRISALTGRNLDLIGHSQGGLEPRWALRFWPDLRGRIDDLVTLAAPHHGTVVSDAYCAAGCKAAHWQMAPASDFLAALNREVETYPEVSTTSLYSLSDELVEPQFPVATSALAGASNIAVQDLCPGRPVDHVGMMRDGAVFALVMDALTHDGPADVARVDPLACADLLIPGIGPVESLQGNYYFFASGNSDVPDAEAEPALAPYVQQCPDS